MTARDIVADVFPAPGMADVLLERLKAEGLFIMATSDSVESDLPTEADEILEMRLSTLAFRMQCRVDACVERNGTVDAAVTSSGVGISYLLARELATTLRAAAERFEHGAPNPTRALARLFAAFYAIIGKGPTMNWRTPIKIELIRQGLVEYADDDAPDGADVKTTALGEAALCLAEDGR